MTIDPAVFRKWSCRSSCHAFLASGFHVDRALGGDRDPTRIPEKAKVERSPEPALLEPASPVANDDGNDHESAGVPSLVIGADAESRSSSARASRYVLPRTGSDMYT